MNTLFTRFIITLSLATCSMSGLASNEMNRQWISELNQEVNDSEMYPQNKTLPEAHEMRRQSQNLQEAATRLKNIKRSNVEAR